ncbi:hypothetical protein [Microbacterium oleivorans]|uniref:hypothetical protein n=1 Tax=Microbacterium oleivorans TaxID=273677 RepID=UPI00080E2684|nr:hypothetical protein [Microbacterium oleivorans]
MARRSPARRGVPSAVVAILVVALTVAVGALVVLALDRGRGTDTDAVAKPAPSIGLDPSPTPSPTASAATPDEPGAAERFLAVGAGAMWRATAGACGDDAPTVERSDDDGDTWTDVTPAYRGIAQVRDLTPFAETEADLVADMGPDCETQALRTFTKGRFWSPYEDLLPQSTYLDGATVVIDGTRIDAPCERPWGLRASGDTTAFICDGAAYAITQGTTTEVGNGVTALDVRDGQIVGALVRPDCNGLQVAPLTPDAAPLGCLNADADGPVALAVTADSIRVWAGDDLVSMAR